MKTKNILICVSGLTPQIVTETLFCLSYKEKISIDEIYILTTKRGRDVILGRDKHPSTPKTALKDEIQNLCKKYKLKEPLFEENDTHIIVAKEESIELPDIRSDKDNILFPNKICELLREKTSEPNNVIYCSITGGRKSMSVHLANALSIFARENDRLVHVLTKEEHEFKGFYPQTKKEINDLELANLPFVRLRPILSAEIKRPDLLTSNFDEIVNFTQKQLKALTPSNKMILDIERRELRFGNYNIELEPLEFLFYYFFVDSKEKGRNNISVQEFISDETKNKFIEYFNLYFPNRYIEEQKWYKKGFSKEDFRVKRSRVNSKINDLIDDPDISSYFVIDVNKKYGSSTYYLKAEKDRFIIK
ncbi:MAG: CRISPR-associated ring nuclease Csm6 [Ignavibacterium sp.]|nr:CRISPR-associated ring nuclease Csm6 [Ignavibacterium sp.]MDW8376451.1 CRISPR-associated ring nuclease Csm6 [Ignavibacteriales bacterium]